MKTVKKNRFLRYGLIILTVFCLFLSAVTFAKSTDVEASVATRSNDEVMIVGDIVAAKDYTLTKNGVNVQAEGLTVIYPSGGVFGGEDFMMSQAGNYEVTYYATVNGTRVEETQRYTAIRGAKDIIVAEAGMDVYFGKYEVDSPYQMTKETYGGVVNFKAGETITFSSNIKTEKLTAEYNIVDLIVMPSVYGETDFDRLTVRVTDSEDPTNFVEILIDTSNTADGDGQISYVKAGANGQRYGGYEGSKYQVGNYGTQAEHSFRAWGRSGDSRKNLTISENSLTVGIDNVEKRVYVGPISNTSTKMSMVNDLDDPAHFKSDPWQGFQSDEVTVHITASRFLKAEGKVVIKSYGDYDFSKEIVDTLAPEITVKYDSKAPAPIAKVGETFPIFPYVAKDNLDKELKESVWVYYFDDNGNKVTVENDGKEFFAKYAGEYKIVYRAEDYSGNVSEEVRTIKAMESTPSVFIGIAEPVVKVPVYQSVTVPKASELQVFGGSGSLNVERVVCAPNGEVLDIDDILELNQLGEYKAVYTITDYLGNVAYGVITYQAEGLEAPTFITEPNFEVKFIKGFTYEISKVFVVETVGDAIVEVPYKVYVNDVLADGKFKIDGEDGSTVEVRYVAEGQTGTTEWTKTFSVVDTENGKYKSRYFTTENEMQIIDQKSYLELNFAENCEAEFINALYSSNFAMTFAYEKANATFSKMTLTFIEGNNRSKTVTVTFLFDSRDNAWLLTLKGNNEKIAFEAGDGVMTFALSANGKRIKDISGEELATLLYYDSGEPFVGFSETVYLRIGFEDVTGQATIYLTQLGNQTRGYSKSSLEKATDEIKPIIVLDDDFLMRQKLGSKAYIPTAKAYDVLGQIVAFTVTLEKVNGETIATGDATQSLDYTLSEAGNYLVTYYAKDNNGNYVRLPYSILVNDETAPTLTVKDGPKSSYKVGAKVTIPTYTVKDNNGTYYVQVMLLMPDNELRMLHYDNNGEITSLLNRDKELYENAFIASSKAFYVLEKGTYTLQILAYDDYYNTTLQEFVFNVK